MNLHGYPQHMSDHQVRTDQAREREGFVDRTWEQIAAYYKEQQRMETTYPRAVKMPDAEYFASDGVSQSMLKLVAAERMREYEARYVTKTMASKEPTRSMELGSAIHGTILDGKSLDDCLRVYPPSCLKSNGHVNPTPAGEWVKTLPEGCTPCKIEELHAVCKAVDAIRHRIGKLLEYHATRFEEAIFWKWNNIIPCKAKLDIVVPRGDDVLIIDLKTTVDASRVGFARAIKQQRYWLQEATYREGGECVYGTRCEFAFLAIEKEPGSMFQVAEHRLLPSVSSQADAARQRYMERLATAYESGDWSDEWERQCNYVDLPNYVFNERD